jgi:hypothetical protein
LLTLVWLKEGRLGLDARTIVENMLRHSCGPYGRAAMTGGDAQVAWGMLVPDTFTSLTCWSIFVNGRELCLAEGDLYDDLPTLKLRPGNNPGLAQYIAGQKREHPDRPLAEVTGPHSGLYIPPDLSCAYVFCDSTGTRSVFWLSDRTRFVMTNNLWAFRGCDGFERRWDTMALSEMLTIGFPLAGRTWLAGVSQLQRGRQVRSLANGRAEVQMLAKPVERQAWSLQTSVRMLRESLDETVKRIHRRLDGPVGLALTGGLDSRTLLASLHTQNIEHRSFTLCLHPSEGDNRVAKSLAALLGRQHETVLLTTPGHITHIEYRLINEGESPGFTLLRLAVHAQRYSKALMIGNEAVRETAGSFQPLSLTSRRDLADKMLREYLKFFPPKKLPQLLAPPFLAPWDDVLSEWYDSFDRIDQPSLMDVFLDHVADYRVQRRTRPRLEQARWYCLPIYPFMDARVFEIYRRIPLSHLHAEQAPLALLSDYRTGLEKLPSAARHFNLPINQEYRYRHLLHLAPVLRELWWPWSERWQVIKARLGLGRKALSPLRDAELQRLQHSELFQGSTVKDILERARRGTFAYADTINLMINAGVIDDFLSGRGFVGKRSLSFLQPSREISLLPSNGATKAHPSLRPA